MMINWGSTIRRWGGGRERGLRKNHNIPYSIILLWLNFYDNFLGGRVISISMALKVGSKRKNKVAGSKTTSLLTRGVTTRFDRFDRLRCVSYRPRLSWPRKGKIFKVQVNGCSDELCWQKFKNCSETIWIFLTIFGLNCRKYLKIDGPKCRIF